jgi:hypothetical protein
MGGGRGGDRSVAGTLVEAGLQAVLLEDLRCCVFFMISWRRIGSREAGRPCLEQKDRARELRLLETETVIVSVRPSPRSIVTTRLILYIKS